MLKRLFVCLFLASCACSESKLSPTNYTHGEPWDNNYLINLNYRDIPNIDLDTYIQIAEKNYWSYCQSEGIVFPGLYSVVDRQIPDRFAAGADSALYTGFALAAFAFKNSLLGIGEETEATLKGMYWLTHAVGRGVLCRAVGPAAFEAKWDYENAWRGRIESGFAGEAEALDTPWWHFPKCFYYTRVTRDQLTGILFGLSVAWKLTLSDNLRTKNIIAEIVQDIRDKLVADNWKIRDQRGLNDTWADVVDGWLKLQLEALYRLTCPYTNYSYRHEALKNYTDAFTTHYLDDVAPILNNYTQYYSHNLRITRAFSIWLLEDNPVHKEEIKNYILNKVWKFTKQHQNAWFAAIVYTITKDTEALEIARNALKSLTLKPLRGWGSPYAGQQNSPTMKQIIDGCADKMVLAPHLRAPTNYFTWAKDPWDPGPLDTNGYLHEARLDFILPYWLLDYAEHLNN